MYNIQIVFEGSTIVQMLYRRNLTIIIYLHFSDLQNLGCISKIKKINNLGKIKSQCLVC